MQWSYPETIGDIPPPSRAHTATLVDRKIVIYGGGQGTTYYDTVYVFDTTTRKWIHPVIAGDIPPPRCAHTAVLYQGKIWVFGGGNGLTALNDLWCLPAPRARSPEQCGICRRAPHRTLRKGPLIAIPSSPWRSASPV